MKNGDLFKFTKRGDIYTFLHTDYDWNGKLIVFYSEGNQYDWKRIRSIDTLIKVCAE